ncbi:uncharacterized protein LOC131937531 [Physella acuta]|uniref:uncharacterized protein LOC131937531 n=1 Tax=Physella acuta TaxID=109671 RepID=UPI0027DC8CF3|nr:uncharacterized protein LOC131937531 [Physella acuta]
MVEKRSVMFMLRRIKFKTLLIMLACLLVMFIWYIQRSPRERRRVSFRKMRIRQPGDEIPPMKFQTPSPKERKNMYAKALRKLPRPLGLHPDVALVPSLPPPDFKLPLRDCVVLPHQPRKNVTICIYKIKDDVWVSGNLKVEKLWEETLVLEMDQALKSNPDLMLVDLGANLGEYTLWAAALGHRALAVEMVLENVRMLQTSLMLSGLSQLVTIVNNALYSDHRTLQVNFMKNNMGGSRLNTSKVFEDLDLTHGVVLTKTICMDDLVPLITDRPVYLKIDIENTEHEALKCASQFFSKVNVEVVQMEWFLRSQAEMDNITSFMSHLGFHMSESATRLIKPVDIETDVFFVRKPARDV